MVVGGGLVAKLCPTLVTSWTEEPDRLQSMGFSRQEYWSGLPFLSLYMYVCMYVCVYIYVYIYMYVCMYASI